MGKALKSSVLRDELDYETLQIFGENLRRLREKAKYSQEQLAYEAGISRSYYAEVETGKRNISLLNILKICSLLRIEVSDIVKLKDIPNRYQ